MRIAIIKFAMYCCIGMTLEVVFSACLLNVVMGKKIKRRAPMKYLEGFVSLFMIPIHGFGMLFVFEPAYRLIAGIPWIARYLIWGALFGFAEALAGFLMDKILGFYPWDYYAESRFKVMKRGYCLWTLLPFWGLYGLLCEVVVRTINNVSPYL